MEINKKEVERDVVLRTIEDILKANLDLFGQCELRIEYFTSSDYMRTHVSKIKKGGHF